MYSMAQRPCCSKSCASCSCRARPWQHVCCRWVHIPKAASNALQLAASRSLSACCAPPGTTTTMLQLRCTSPRLPAVPYRVLPVVAPAAPLSETTTTMLQLRCTTLLSAGSCIPIAAWLQLPTAQHCQGCQWESQRPLMLTLPSNNADWRCQPARPH